MVINSSMANENPASPQTVGGSVGHHPTIKNLPILASPSTSDKGKNTIRMELIPVACWKLDDVRFAFASSFVLPETREEFTHLAQLRKDHHGAPLSVFGHADPVGDDAFNKQLSGHRADSIYAVLIRDTARWEKLYLAGGQSEGWGTSSIQHMLTAVGDDPGPVTGSLNATTQKAIKQFQTKNDLTSDGIAGPKTRAKLFLAYMEFLSPEKLNKTDFLSKGADPNGKGDVQGCGEFNPMMVFSQQEQKTLPKSERDSQNAVNRRVMILLFRPGVSVSPDKWPCPRTSEGPDACRKRFWSDGEHRRTPREQHREFGQTRDTFACRFYHRLVITSPCEGVPPPDDQHWIEIQLTDRAGKPATGVAYRIKLPDGEIVSGLLDENGRARQQNLNGGTCLVSFPDLDGDAWTRTNAT